MRSPAARRLAQAVSSSTETSTSQEGARCSESSSPRGRGTLRWNSALSPGPAAEGRSDAKHSRKQVPTGMSYLSFHNTMRFTCRRRRNGVASAAKRSFRCRSAGEPASNTALRERRTSRRRSRRLQGLVRRRYQQYAHWCGAPNQKAGTPDRLQGPTGKACQRPQGHPDSHPATTRAKRVSGTGRPQAMTRPRRWEESGERPRTECRTSGRGRSRPPNSVVNPKSTRRALKRRGCRGRRFHPGGTWASPHPSVSPTGTALPSESTRQTKDVPLSSAPWPSVRLCASSSSSSVSPGTSIPTRTPGTGRSPFVEHYALQLRADRSGA